MWLFSFYALLNLGILFIAWFKAWRSLNLLGFSVYLHHRRGSGAAVIIAPNILPARSRF